eukprot:Awhi_evm1s13698
MEEDIPETSYQANETEERFERSSSSRLPIPAPTTGSYAARQQEMNGYYGSSGSHHHSHPYKLPGAANDISKSYSPSSTMNIDNGIDRDEHNDNYYSNRSRYSPPRITERRRHKSYHDTTFTYQYDDKQNHYNQGVSSSSTYRRDYPSYGNDSNDNRTTNGITNGHDYQYDAGINGSGKRSKSVVAHSYSEPRSGFYIDNRASNDHESNGYPLHNDYSNEINGIDRRQRRESSIQQPPSQFQSHSYHHHQEPIHREHQSSSSTSVQYHHEPHEYDNEISPRHRGSISMSVDNHPLTPPSTSTSSTSSANHHHSQPINIGMPGRHGSAHYHDEQEDYFSSYDNVPSSLTVRQYHSHQDRRNRSMSSSSVYEGYSGGTNNSYRSHETEFMGGDGNSRRASHSSSYQPSVGSGHSFLSTPPASMPNDYQSDYKYQSQPQQQQPAFTYNRSSQPPPQHRPSYSSNSNGFGSYSESPHPVENEVSHMSSSLSSRPISSDFARMDAHSNYSPNPPQNSFSNGNMSNYTNDSQSPPSHSFPASSPLDNPQVIMANNKNNNNNSPNTDFHINSTSIKVDSAPDDVLVNRRKMHNLLERKRRSGLRELFSGLASELWTNNPGNENGDFGTDGGPAVNENGNVAASAEQRAAPPKVTILQQATNEIIHLRHKGEQLNAVLERQKQENVALKQKLSMLS